MNSYWLEKFAASRTSFLPSSISDHTPVIVYFQDQNVVKARPFKYLIGGT